MDTGCTGVHTPLSYFYGVATLLGKAASSGSRERLGHGDRLD